MSARRAGALVALVVAVGAFVVVGISRSSQGSQSTASTAFDTALRQWTAKDLTGSVALTGQVPAAVAQGSATLVRPHPAGAMLRLNFGFPIANTAGLNALIAEEARSHRYISRSELYDRFSPPATQLNALSTWLKSQGFKVTYVGLDRMALSASATTAQVQRALHVQVKDFIHPASTFDGVKVAPYAYYANTTAPVVPARLGLQMVSGLSDVDRFFTDAQLTQANQGHAASTGPEPATNGCGDSDSVIHPLCPHVRFNGYFPSDISSMYDVGHGYDGTGQTLGFTLWGAGETQSAMTTFAMHTGDTPITVDAPCTPLAGSSPTVPSSCATRSVAANHLLTILENGNTNDNFAGNDETGLDIEQAHGLATNAGMKYYEADCSTSVPVGSGLVNSNCDGSDVGLEDAVEDAANDPTLHTVSNSWLYGGDPEWGAADPFTVAVENSLQIAAAAGTTFWFSTGDSGSYESGFPGDSPYAVSVGGTSLFSTTSSSTLSTEDTWAAGGSWCSNIFARPAWQTGPGVAANAPCPGRVMPDVSADADTSTPVYEAYSTSPGTSVSGSVGGTSVAAPLMSGMEADTESFVAAQHYAGATPPIGFEGPIIYQLGNSNSDAYYRDVLCGNTASPDSSPDGDAAQPGWDSATGWGAPDWAHFATGYAIALGATGLTVPASLSQHYAFTCAKTPSNSNERSIAFPSSSVGYAVGSPSSGAPWYARFLAGGAWGTVNTFFKTVDGGKTWFPSNSDMTSIACKSASSCVEVGDGGRIRVTSDSGATWTDVASGFDKGLTQVACPSTSICYAAGDRGVVLKSGDGGNTWSYLQSTDGNPIYGLTCASTTTCYATDVYAHIIKTTDGGNTWTWQRTPITSPGVNVPASGGPLPAGALFGISCVDAAGNDCVAVGGYPPTGTDSPIVTTTDGGTTWTLQTSNSGANNHLHAVACIQSTTTCFAVGNGGSIVTTTNMSTWARMTSNTASALNSIVCQSATSCEASGQNGTVDRLSGSTWTVSSGNGGGTFLAGISCINATSCYAAGKQGVTIATSNGSTWTQQAGGGTTQTMNSIACPSTTTCFAVGGAGTILATTNAGQTWLAQASATAATLNSISCTTTTTCTAVGTSGAVSVTTNGSTWSTGGSGTGETLNGVSCSSVGNCTAVGTGGAILTTADGGQSWQPQTSGTDATLNAISCMDITCYATGNISGSQAVMLKTTDGSTWIDQGIDSDGAALSGLACLDASDCFAGGGAGTVLSTTDGTNWVQQGNPLSGPVAAPNDSLLSIDQINGVACSAATCAMATGSSGDIMITPLLTVTVTLSASGTLGATPVITGIAPSSANLSYSPSSQAANVTGSLTCFTSATSTSGGGTYPITGCSGLSAPGYSVVYELSGATYTVSSRSQTITFGPIPEHFFGDPPFASGASSSSGLTPVLMASGSCSVSGTTIVLPASGPDPASCTVTASQPGDADYDAATSVSRTFSILPAGPKPSVSVLVTVSGVYGTSPTLSGIAPSSPSIIYSQPAQAVNVTGTLSCTTSATSTSDVAKYAITGCSGLSLAGYDVVYDLDASSYTVTIAPQTITFPAVAGHHYGDAPFASGAISSSGLAPVLAASGACSVSGTTIQVAASGSADANCTITASQPGSLDYEAAANVPRSFVVSPVPVACACPAMLSGVLSISFPGGTAPTFGVFSPGIAAAYTTTLVATTTATTPAATFSASDTSTTFPGHLVNTVDGGPYELANGLQVDASSAHASDPNGYQDLSSASPATLLSYSAPFADDAVTVAFMQSVSATEPLHTGTYSKTITFTLASGTP